MTSKVTFSSENHDSAFVQIGGIQFNFLQTLSFLEGGYKWPQRDRYIRALIHQIQGSSTFFSGISHIIKQDMH